MFDRCCGANLALDRIGLDLTSRLRLRAKKRSTRVLGSTVPASTEIRGGFMTASARYPGIRVTANGNQLVAYHTETRIADAGVFYPITPSTEGGELFQQAYAEGHLNVFGGN